MATTEFLKRFGYMFYLAHPNYTSFERSQDVPDYFVEVIPLFVIFLLVEIFVSVFKHDGSLYRINDGVSSISQGIIQETIRIILGEGGKLATYVWIYDNCRILELPWNSSWTWLICFVGVDLGYYWAHRCGHEIHFMWAAHQVHHSSEEYNFSTALRQSLVQSYILWIFYLPLALFMPPSVYLVHSQFNTIYQFWIHTQVVRKIGPLELILNTPSHHRVHHGRNRYCIDKNYGGTLIIWDRLFNTFEAEDEEVVYGITHPLQTFDPFVTQMCHYIYLWQEFWKADGINHKMSLLFKGPGWTPGKPRLGEIEDIPDVHAPVEKYDPDISQKLKFYVLLHFCFIILGYIMIAHRKPDFGPVTITCAMAYLFWSLSTMAALLDGKSHAPVMEFLRCVTYFAVDLYVLPFDVSSPISPLGKLVIMATRILYFLSTIITGMFAYLNQA